MSTSQDAATGRNAPNPNARLSVLVDVATAAVDDARAAGLHPLADEIDAVRQRVADLAMRYWRREAGER